MYPLPQKISSRQQEILSLIAYEYTNQQIAKRLYLSVETIHTHRKNLLRKLSVKNTAGLVRVGIEQKLIIKPASTAIGDDSISPLLSRDAAYHHPLALTSNKKRGRE